MQCHSSKRGAIDTLQTAFHHIRKWHAASNKKSVVNYGKGMLSDFQQAQRDPTGATSEEDTQHLICTLLALFEKSKTSLQNSMVSKYLQLELVLRLSIPPTDLF